METYDNAKPEMETTFSNPWNVSDLSDFLRYCCPECDYKCEEVHSFCNHAIEEHENSRVLIKKDQFEESEFYLNQELDFADGENLEVVEDFDPIHEDYSLIKEPKTPPRRNYKDLISKLSNDVPNGKNVKIMKLTKQPDGKLQCQLCENIFDAMNDVVKHMPNCAKLDSAKEIKKTDVITNWKCSACDLPFDDQKDLDKHYRDPSCKKAKPFECDICHAYFVIKASLTKHIKMVHEALKCDFCDKEFLGKTALEKHINYHTNPDHEGKKPYNCEFCEASFSQKSGMEYHILAAHEGKKTFDEIPLTIEIDENGWLTCDKCPNENFYFIFELQLHREKVHENEVKLPTTKTDRDFLVNNFAKREMIFQKNGWACKICEPEIKFEHKFQMITHWHEKHSSGGLYEPCQWCCEVFQSPDQNLVSSFLKLHT